jgi:cytochrome bd ubiquinol oxidase subunit II
MLLALGLRGVSFEFRYQVERGRRAWDVAFGLGSIIAALMQGFIVGGLIQGLAIDGERFSGSVFDVFQPFSLLVAASVLAGYMVLGGGWLHLKATHSLQSFADRSLRRTTPVFVGLAAATCAAASFVQPGVSEAWTSHPEVLTIIVILFLSTAGALMQAIGRSSALRPFLLGLVLFVLGVAGLGITIFPDIVPFRLTLWQAASASLSHVFLLIGAAIVTPVVLAYSAFAYRVFRGKTPEKGWET